MSRILLIETSTSLCSVALADGDRIAASRESTEPRAHAAMTAPFVKEVLDEKGWRRERMCFTESPGGQT